ncbi:MAG: MFS transporter [Vicinamibacteria bacterium]|nr:MFS transporter [Vicinamibacteria bacterium]
MPASTRSSLAILSLAMLLSSLGTSIANVALPTLAVAFHASFQEVQWIVLAYLLAITTLIVSVGRLGDLIGQRRLMLTGLGLFTFASLLCGLSPTLRLLIAARAVQGLAAAIMMALTMSLVGETVSKEKSGSAMGLLGTMSAIGTALGPSLGGLLIAGFGWPSIFLINVPLGLVALLLAYRRLPLDRVSHGVDRAPFDVAGTVTLGLTLAAYALALTAGRGHFGRLNWALLLSSLVGIGVFGRVESRAASPLVRLEILSDPVLRARLAVSSLVSTVVMATLVVGPFYLSGALQLDAARVGLVMSAGPLIAAIAGVPSGRLVDRFGVRGMTIAGLLAMALGASILPAMPTRFGVPGYIGPLIVITAGYALFQAANNTAVMSNTGQGQRGLISGMLNLSRNLGLITGASIMGAVFAFTSGADGAGAVRPEAVAIGMRATFAVAALLVYTALAILATSERAARPKQATRPRPEWLVPALLILLSLVPSVFGVIRLLELARGAQITPANARFFERPWPVVLHVLSVIPYSIIGAWQFAPGFRRTRRTWHRAAGRVIGALGLVAALTGLWMAHFYPWPEGDGSMLHVLRLLFGSAMATAIVLGVAAILRGDVTAHGAWMLRAYAIGLAAGTQVFTHLPWFILVGQPDETSRAALMGLGWLINLAVAEWIIGRSAKTSEVRSPSERMAPHEQSDWRGAELDRDGLRIRPWDLWSRLHLRAAGNERGHPGPR